MTVNLYQLLPVRGIESRGLESGQLHRSKETVANRAHGAPGGASNLTPVNWEAPERKPA